MTSNFARIAQLETALNNSYSCLSNELELYNASNSERNSTIDWIKRRSSLSDAAMCSSSKRKGDELIVVPKAEYDHLRSQSEELSKSLADEKKSCAEYKSLFEKYKAEHETLLLPYSGQNFEIAKIASPLRIKTISLSQPTTPGDLISIYDTIKGVLQEVAVSSATPPPPIAELVSNDGFFKREYLAEVNFILQTAGRRWVETDWEGSYFLNRWGIGVEMENGIFKYEKVNASQVER